MIGRAPFGATGHDSSRVIFGAAALGSVSKADADRALDVLLEHGVNHIDVAASYGDAELRIASWLQRHPGTFFVATKTGERTYRGAREEIRRSLDRLGVDRIDSIQLHNLVDVIEWETALGADGALEAAIEAREEGLVRFIGVTGHGLSVPEMHRRSLERFAVRLGARARTTTCRCRIRATPRRSRRWPRSAPSATSRCRRSRASPAAAGTAARTPPRPGTSRCASRPTSTSRCTGCSAGRRRSCSPPATSRSCRGCSTRPSGSSGDRRDEEMAALAARREATPLFV